MFDKAFLSAHEYRPKYSGNATTWIDAMRDTVKESKSRRNRNAVR